MKIATFLVLAFLATGCVGDIAWQKPHDGKSIGEDLKSSLLSIEIDDDGDFHQKEQRENLSKWLKRDEHLPLLVYVHGWHHNAKYDDTNLADFTDFVSNIANRSGTPMRALYVGWRGDSFDVAGLPELIDFFTIWGRKGASKRVGEKGLSDILDEIRKNDSNKDEKDQRRVMFLSHSLGASALFHAVKSDLDDAYNDSYEYVLMNPAASDEEFKEVDIALRAKLAQTIDVESSTIDLEEFIREHRKMVVLQSLGDWPVKFFYRLAFLPTTPIGFKKERLTHDALVCDDPTKCRKDKRDCDRLLADDRFLILARGANDDECRNYSMKSLWVVTGDDAVSRDHNDIFNGIQEEVIISLIADRFEMTMTSE